MKNIFRALIIFSIFIYAFFVAKQYFDSSFHSKETLDLLSWNGFEALLTMPSWLTWLTVLIWLPVSIGIYYFNRMARTAYLVLAITFTVTLPLFGMHVYTGTDMMLYQLTAILDGIILTMAYLTSISAHFKNA